ncbi:Very-long-chain (3R)-3-hydroxyacyl-CoA dehydratase hpo-8 (Probable 3-hydroxyacyl-CoA dehydratase) [Durusdinium trenchii]|uniref:very-long-chain (3R)-3-hydroxyacyl-CoA dehydratase n=1 Tax=Durusdinium trenchii TaxID=1381693 RepID=A0ABP0RJD2_9DINO
MGPFPLLMQLGAHVVALDLPKPEIWKRLISVARRSPGKLTLPLHEKVDASDDAQLAAAAGCDLLRQTPEVRNWLLELGNSGKCGSMVLGAYCHVPRMFGVRSTPRREKRFGVDQQQIATGLQCYADGPLFVRVSMAMDAIIADLVEGLKEKPKVAYLCTPTDAHICTASSKQAAAENLRKAPAWQPLLGKLLGFAKMGLEEPGALPVVDAIVKEQGPNYCLAKRLQHWRAILSRSKGCVVSSNIAPATATARMHHFKPMEVFQGETSNAVMLGLLVNDLRNPSSAGTNDALRRAAAAALVVGTRRHASRDSEERRCPENRSRVQTYEFYLSTRTVAGRDGPEHAPPAQSTTANPMQLFTATAFHGGVGCSAVAYIVASMVVPCWLVIYSTLQMLGWSSALFLIGSQGAPAAEAVISKFTYFQIAEILHAVLGMVPSNPVTTAMQITSRVGAVQIVAAAASAASRSAMLPWMTLFYVAWSITEVVRYSYYALNTAGVQLSPLTWLRYSTFLLLYPAGVTGVRFPWPPFRSWPRRVNDEWHRCSDR